MGLTEAINNMRLLLWNVEFGRHALSIQRLDELISNYSCDVACVTETTLDYLARRDYVLRSRGDYGYDDRAGHRQKVTLWSSQPWSEVDFEGISSLPPGRFVSGITHGIRFVGVCVPWAMAHVTTGTKSKARWEDHRQYLQGLSQLLGLYQESETETCLLGDFNQAIPPTQWNMGVFPILKDALPAGFRVWTGNVLDRENKTLIDHVATGNTLNFTVDEIIEKTDDSSNILSDHAGIIGTLLTLRPVEPSR
jgi:hypothetical protein